MNLFVNSNPESIAAAIELERRTEAAKVEEAFAAILACELRGAGSLHPWIFQPQYSDDALRRHRETVIPRLRAIVKGRRSESEPVRFSATVALSKLDRGAGCRAMSNLLKSDDPTVLTQALDELATVLITVEEERLVRADYAPVGAELERIIALLDHPNEKVARAAGFLLGEIGSTDISDRYLVPRMQDPVLGADILRILAWEGRFTPLLEATFAALNGSGRIIEDDRAVEILVAFAGSRHPLNASRSQAMMESLLGKGSLLPKERERLRSCLDQRGVDQLREASRPVVLARATAQVERIVAAGIIDREAGDRAIAMLGSDGIDNWDLTDCLGAREAFRAAGIVHGVDWKNEDYPPGHDDLIRDLAGISQGLFRPEGVCQLRENRADEEYDYPVQFVHQDRLYQFDVEYRRSAYDVDSVLEAVNEALADVSEPKRFVVLGISGPRDIMFAFCDPTILEPIAEQLGLKPKVPVAVSIGSQPMPEDLSRHRSWNRIADMVGDVERKLPPEELIRWKSPKDGQTALHRAVQCLAKNEVYLLLAAGADVNARPPLGSPIYTVGRTPLYELLRATTGKRTLVFEALMAAGADVHAVNDYGRTLLHSAAEEGDLWLAERLLSFGADPNSREHSHQRYTPLHWAARNGYTEIVRVLLDRGAEADAPVRRPRRYPELPKQRPNPIAFSRSMVTGHGAGYLLCDGQTALHLAVIEGRAAVFELLLDRGAEINVADDRAHTALDLAIILDRGEPFRKLLQERGARSNV
jgi:hypothetical protein